MRRLENKHGLSNSTLMQIFDMVQCSFKIVQEILIQTTKLLIKRSVNKL